MLIKNYIQQNEGLCLKPYKCSAGKLTIGYGRNLEDIGISRDEAEDMLMNDIGRCCIEATSIFGTEFYPLQNNVKTVIIDMLFNLGKPRFKGFKRMIKAIKNKDFDLAAKELLDSRYARQLPDRANRNAKLIRRK